jgi:hypothetical protein
MWDKMKCYWEHVKEHKLETWGTHWKFDGNILKTRQIQEIQHPQFGSPKDKNWAI